MIRCVATDVNSAEIRLHQSESGLGALDSLSPLFGKLWNDDSRTLGPEFGSLLRRIQSSTYQIVRSNLNLIGHTLNFDQLFTSQNEPLTAILKPLISPPEWNAALSKLTEAEVTNPVIFICGPKSSGKSTFARLLTNRLSSIRPSSTKSSSRAGLALLDLDPGQPEYSTPGHLSLIHLQEPNFGPPYSHPLPHGRSRTIRSHAIGALTPSMDTNFYMECAADLFEYYQNLLSTDPNCPLLINTPGWVLGTGLELLIDLIAKIQPTDIVYMSQSGPPEVTKSLKEAGGSTPLFTLPSQTSDFTTRTAAHLRTMQAMSYFHIDSGSGGQHFNHDPLTSMPPWEVCYSGQRSGILGIICYGEQPAADLLAETINGSLVSIVVVDDDRAIPGWGSQDHEPMKQHLTIGADTHFFDLSPERLQEPLLMHTPGEGLPYFDPRNNITLDPTHSHCIGLALIRGIDVRRRRLQILTAVPANDIKDINEHGKKIVLVSGKLDTPGWAYTEELCRRGLLEKERRKQGEDIHVGEDEREIGDDLGNAPWVERLEGSQGRGLGGRVWRVRRDLGKMGDGD